MRSIPLTKGTPLKELKGRLDEVLARAAEVGDAHVRVTLQVDVGAEVFDAKHSNIHPLFSSPARP